MTVRIERIEGLDGDRRAAITAPFAEAATVKRFAFSPHHLTLALTDEHGIDGGLIAQLYWDWMHVEILAVPERWRGKGLGRALLAEAESVAAASGCTGAWVDTYSFQSPGFYERMGYSVFGRLPNYPAGEERIFFAKQLRAAD
ncbi:GNAT family N-acetyltransferase [Aurantimonas sp. HBX-1]|uniref:GNAT family N-acetyltransferase n=1 Tax=Aurantimonas sp. HBX-1 TaxID=2906072 RepID=UPI001F3CD393|nr:GNAT family N-acetyltransferase [Aurantimonas sp. HBX-1]UIJ70728.1 GNAT family N-acetyltransferase [Aurantimonas sp. HBX-1]